MYVFDVHGTLVNNPTVSDEDIRKMLLVLRTAGHHLVIVSEDLQSVPEDLKALVDECRAKPISFADFDEDTVVFDDCTHILRCAAQLGVRTVAASQMGAWLENEAWNGSGRQDV